MRLFRWLSAKSIPRSMDLRQFGWTLIESATGEDDVHRHPALAQLDTLDEEQWRELSDWRFAPLRSLILLIGVDDENARARLLRHGFGDVTASTTNLHEIEARVLRIAAQAESLPRIRQFGGLKLDLFARDAFAQGRRLSLHPREFALMWRLSDNPGVAVAKKALIRDVWRMAYVPETNSLAVHVYRLRAKLASVGLEWMVQTTIDGCYRLQTEDSDSPSPAPHFADQTFDEDFPLALAVHQSLLREPPG